MAEVLIILLASTVAFALVARRLKVPDAIFLVLAGLVLSLVPGLPEIDLRPEYIFVIVLPPLLHAQAWITSWKDFRDHLHGISLLAVGLVLFTTTVVALVTHALIPDIPIACAFVLGAIVSPPDAVAASSVAKALKLPARIVTLLEGESLVNDATGLVAYKFALAAAATGTFSLASASSEFLLVSAGGVAIGLAMGFAVSAVFRSVKDDTITTALSVVAPYVSWYFAERLHVSGVLAAVTGGIVLGAKASNSLSAGARLQGFGFWNTFVFLLNGVVFTLIGLQLPGIVQRGCSASWAELLFDGLVVFGATIVARLVWVFPAAYLPRLMFHRRGDTSQPPWKHVLIVGWAGMRGVVSLAAALALPLLMPGGAAFPARDRLIFLAFCVILGTLVLQGLTLPWLIRRLGVAGAGLLEAEEERGARLASTHAALAAVRRLAKSGQFFATSSRVVAGEYEDRLRELERVERARVLAPATDDPQAVMHLFGSVELRRAALAAERTALLARHHRRDLSKELLLRLERELDMAESRLPQQEAAAHAAASSAVVPRPEPVEVESA